MRKPSSLELDAIDACRGALDYLTCNDRSQGWVERRDVIDQLRRVLYRANRKQKRRGHQLPLA